MGLMPEPLVQRRPVWQRLQQALEPMPLGLQPETQALQEQTLLESARLEQQALEQQVWLRPLAQP